MTPISDKHAQHNTQRDWDAETDAIENAPDENGGNWQAAPNGTSGNGGLDIDNGQRHELIAIAAYFLAERRQFQNGSPEDDWLQAEAEIDRRLIAGNP
jgi:hypothetical protein